ncbi:MAG: hypothetical protein HY518_01335 [Candidatus Aenigmarchaeota archaeon]|nr:hypothetical protein [Candidatus Aenigmarchaeota archaeon]
MKVILYAIAIGILLGSAVGVALSVSFPGLQPVVNSGIALEDTGLIFIKNALLVTLIAFGGIIFSLLEIRFHKSRKAYYALDRTVSPLYSVLGRFCPAYRSLGLFYRSIYLSLKAFPAICIFLVFFTISLYFAVFLLLLEGAASLLFNLVPHIALELYAFASSAALALQFSAPLRKRVMAKDIEGFWLEAKEMLVSRGVWWRMAWLYFVLLAAAFMELVFISGI